MGKPFLVFEHVATTPRRQLFRMGGISWQATRYAGLSPLFWSVLGLAVARLEVPTSTTSQWLATGVAYGALLYATNVIHSLGHVVAGWLVRAPMASVLLTATRDVTIYVRRGATLPRGTRIARAAGGPAMNLAIGVLAVGLAPLVDWRLAAMAGYFNIGIAIWTLLPIPTLDGSVIWSSLLRATRRPA